MSLNHSPCTLCGPGQGVTLSVDPAIYHAGRSLFVSGTLISSVVVELKESEHRTAAETCAVMARRIVTDLPAAVTQRPIHLIFEWPRIYAERIRMGKKGADPNDLLVLAGVCAAVSALLPYAYAICYEPSEWKGSVPGDTFLDRIIERLTPQERAFVPEGKHAHNGIDSIGIGLKHLGRLERRRVIAR